MYEILEGYNIERLTDAVNDALLQGAQLQGGVSVAVTSETEYSNSYKIFIQAIMWPIDDTKATIEEIK